MSTAAPFKHIRPFPFCLYTGSFGYPSVNVTLAQAMNFYWNMEDISIETTGAEGSTSIDWTFDLTNSTYPFSGSLVESGSYFNADYPAGRVCNRFEFPYYESALYLSADQRASGPQNDKIISLNFLILASNDSAKPVRIEYFFIIRDYLENGFGAIEAITEVQSGLYTDYEYFDTLPPSYGEFYIAGCGPFLWHGGGLLPTGSAETYWSTNPASITFTSTTFSY